jgi:3-oxoacyl-[acyl-carrier protein] reductase
LDRQHYDARESKQGPAFAKATAGKPRLRESDGGLGSMERKGRIVMGILRDKVVVVTGASKGIGAGIARRFGAEGAKVVVNYATSRSEAERVVNDIKAAGGQATAMQADVTQRQDVERLFAETKKTYGFIDVLVNNAGVYEFRALEDIDQAHFRRMFDINVLGLLHATREAARLMNGDGGSIINISSIAAKTPPPTSAVYSATKGAVDVITRVLAQELAPRKIRVNSLSPGFTETEGIQAARMDDAQREYTVSRTPLARAGTPDDIAKAALFLASDQSGWITGEEILVGGGLRL